MDSQCNHSWAAQHDWQLVTLTAPPPQTVEEVIRDQDTPREYRGKRLAWQCRWCHTTR